MTISDSLTRMIHSTEDFIQGVPKPSRSIILFLGGNFCDELNQNITLRPHPHVLRDVDFRLFPKIVVLRDKSLEPLIKTRLVEILPVNDRQYCCCDSPVLTSNENGRNGSAALGNGRNNFLLIFSRKLWIAGKKLQ